MGKIIKAKAPLKKELITIRLLIIVALLFLIVFVFWFFTETRIGHPVLYWPLTIALIYKLLRKLHEWYHYFSISVPDKPDMNKDWTVDMFTTACPGEPHDMIVHTLKCMKQVKYPHNTYLCDEGNDEALKKVCDVLDVIHVTRTEKKDAKAGNINNALKSSNGEICVILDPDHAPEPEFLDSVLPYFNDPEIGYVQCVQAYHNRRESLVALGAAEQTYHFYGPMMMCMQKYGTVQAIGANCTFRREALDSIGGHAAGLSEDMHTAMQLHAKGWKSVYIPEILTRGQVPSSMSAYYKQQLKWSRGTFDLLFHVYPKLFRNFTLRQKIHYLTLPLHFLSGLITAIDIFIPVLSLFLSQSPWLVSFTEFCAYSTPVIIMSLLIRMYIQRWLLEPHERGFHMVGGLLRIGAWWIYLTGFIYTILNIKVPYIPTPKDDQAHNEGKIGIPNIIIILISIVAIWFGLNYDWSPYSLCMSGFVLINITILTYNVIIAQQKLLSGIYSVFTKGLFSIIEYRTRLLWWYFRQSLYFLLRNASFLITISGVVYVSIYIYIQTNKSVIVKIPSGYVDSKMGLRMAGVDLVDSNTALLPMKNDIQLVKVDLEWNLKSIQRRLRTLEDVTNTDKTPYFRFREFPYNHNDSVVSSFFNIVAKYSFPVFVSIPAPDLSPDSSRQRFKELVKNTRKSGCANIVWVWNINHFSNPHEYFPGKGYADWVEISFDSLSNKSLLHHYRPYRKFFLYEKLPIVVTGINSQNLENKTFLEDLLNHDEIKAIVFDQGANINHSWLEKFTWQTRKFNSKLSDFGVSIFSHNNQRSSGWRLNNIYNDTIHHSNIQGVLYNIDSDWDQVNLPLTRDRVRSDLDLLKKIGANTVLIPSGMYDRNLIKSAEEKELSVIYEFKKISFEDFIQQGQDYEDYVTSILDIVNEYKDYTCIKSWKIGTDMWSELRNKCDNPLLIYQRIEYLKMIQRLATGIKAVDSNYKVIIPVKVNSELINAVQFISIYSPDLDMIEFQIENLENVSLFNEFVTSQIISIPFYINTSCALNIVNSDTTRLSDADRLISLISIWNKNKNCGNENYSGGIFTYCRDSYTDKVNMKGLMDYKGRIKSGLVAVKKLFVEDQDSSEADILELPPIQLSPKQIIPGKFYEFYISNNSNVNHRYEWRVGAKSHIYDDSKIYVNKEGTRARIYIPDIPDEYYIHLYCEQKNNSVAITTLKVKL